MPDGVRLFNMKILMGLVVSLCSLGFTQSVPALLLAQETYLSLSDVARLMNYNISESADSLTLQADTGVLVVFDKSPDALWKPNNSQTALEESDLTLSAPIRKQDGRWYAPEQLFELFDMQLSGYNLVLPNGQQASLSFPQAPAVSSLHFAKVELGNSVFGLGLYVSGSVGPETLSMLIVDVGLLALARPEQQRNLDNFMNRLERGRPLYFVLTSLAESPWETSVRITQQGRSVDIRYPFELSILSGQPGLVSPQQPVSGVLLLPEWVNLRQSLSVEWSGVRASFQFRQ